MNAVIQDSELLPLVRAQVKERLTQSPAFRALPKEKRDAIAHDTVKALHYIVGGPDGRSRPTAMTLAGNWAHAQAGGDKPPAQAPRNPLGQAAREGSSAFTETVANVNFPAFVGGLIDGVFNSIVTSSIEQMEAYAELVKNVSKSVDQYMRDNVTENHARDYLAQKYPEHLEVDIAGDHPRLKPREGRDEENIPDFFADLGLVGPVDSLDEDNVEEVLVPAARRRIAMDRQQLLATMVMMGVNRLVVTNGTIEASCLFELDTTDAAKRSRSATTTADWSRERQREWGGEGSTTRSGKNDWKWSYDRDEWDASASGSGQHENKASWYSKGTQKDTAALKVSTARSGDSEEKIQMHAQLGGKVKVNFKSDYFPMERMIDALQINQIREKTAVAAPQAPAPAPLPSLPPPPPLPTTPSAPGPVPPAAR